jgi:hypothetical protein
MLRAVGLTPCGLFGPPNGSHAKLCGRSRVPKPERRAGCRD